MDQVTDVDIEQDGVFKYILIKVTPKGKKAGDASKVVVRGYSWADYHGQLWGGGEAGSIDLSHSLPYGGYDKICTLKPPV